jgi:hypothetical protein
LRDPRSLGNRLRSIETDPEFREAILRQVIHDLLDVMDDDHSVAGEEA